MTGGEDAFTRWVSPHRRDPQKLRAIFKAGKSGAIRTGHEHLRAERHKPVIKRRAARGIEVGGDLVEQYDGTDAAKHGNKARMGENDADEKRFLLAGRGSRRVCLFGPWTTWRSAACGPIRVRPAAASRARFCRSTSRYTSSASIAGRVATRSSTSPFSVNSAKGNGESASLSCKITCIRCATVSTPRRGDGDREFGNFTLRRIQPLPIARSIFEETIAIAQGAFERVDPVRRGPHPAPGRDDRGTAAVRLPARKTAHPSPASARRYEYDRQKSGSTLPARGSAGSGARDCRRAEARFPSRAEASPRRVSSFPPRRQRYRCRRRGHIRQVRPGAIRALGTERNRLHQIGFSGTVFACQHDKARHQIEIECRIGPEIGKNEPGRGGPRAELLNDCSGFVHVLSSK